MVRLIPRFKKKKNKGSSKSKSKAVEERSLSSNQDGETSISTSSTKSSERIIHYGENVTSSLVARYAQMSTTIAATLTEKEFGAGKQNNNLYHPNAEYSSRVIHPVECKRDIFVESVTPMRKPRIKKKKIKSASIYIANVGRQRSPYLDSHDVHDDAHGASNSNSNSKPKAVSVQSGGKGELNVKLNMSNSREENSGIGGVCSQPVQVTQTRGRYSNNEHESLSLTYSDDRDNEIERNSDHYFGSIANSQQSGNIEPAEQKRRTNKNDDLENIDNPNRAEFEHDEPSNHHHHHRQPSMSVRTKVGVGKQFRPKNNHNLRIETGSFANEGIGVPMAELNTNAYNMNSVRDHPRVSRSTAMDISPSSTVSSLTLPAEIDHVHTYTTPKDVFHQAAMPIITEDDGKFSEI